MINNLLQGIFIRIYDPYDTTKEELYKTILEIIRCHTKSYFIIRDISIEIDKEIKRTTVCKVKVCYVNFEFISNFHLNETILNNEKLIKKEINKFIENKKDVSND